jgi:predicted amidohydrolase
MGADMIINVVKTTTPDRAQELVLARANAIFNQVFMISVNCAGPTGEGRSIIVDPEGTVLSEAPDGSPCVLSARLDMGHPGRVRSSGTAGLNRMWSQLRADDAAIELPIYGGRITPATWTPVAHTKSQP